MFACPGRGAAPRRVLAPAGLETLSRWPVPGSDRGLITFEAADRGEAERAVSADAFVEDGLLDVYWLKEWTPERE